MFTLTRVKGLVHNKINFLISIVALIYLGVLTDRNPHLFDDDSRTLQFLLISKNIFYFLLSPERDLSTTASTFRTNIGS